MYTQCLRWRRARRGQTANYSVFSRAAQLLSFISPPEMKLCSLSYVFCFSCPSVIALLNGPARWPVSQMLHLAGLHAGNISNNCSKIRRVVWHTQRVGFLSDQWSQFGLIGVNGNTWWATRMCGVSNQSVKGRMSVWCCKGSFKECRIHWNYTFVCNF